MEGEIVNWDAKNGEKNKGRKEMQEERKQLLKERETRILEELSKIQRLLHPLEARRKVEELNNVYHALKIIRDWLENNSGQEASLDEESGVDGKKGEEK